MLQNDSNTKGRLGGGAAGILRALLVLYTSWKTLLINAILFAVYYFIFYETIVRSNAGFFLLSIPYYLFFLLVLSSSVLATVGISYLWRSRRSRSLAGVAQSPLGVAVGALVASCSCSIPVLGPALYFLGLNALEVSGVISFLASYQQAVILAIVILDVVSVFYYLRLISKSMIAIPVTLGSRRPTSPRSMRS